jgi:hypothetical protein
MMDRKPQATTKLRASRGPRLPTDSLARRPRIQSRPIVELAARCPSATGFVTTAMNGASPTSTMLARRKR